MNPEELFMQRYGALPPDFSAENIAEGQAGAYTNPDGTMKRFDTSGLGTAADQVRGKFGKKAPAEDELPVEAAML